MMAALVLAFVALGTVATIGIVATVVRAYRRKAQRAGYGSLGDYLRAAPRTDEEKQDAVDLALKGVVLCVSGLVFPPFLLVGLVPLYYGGRKIAYSSLGLGLVEDVDPPSA